MRRGARESGMVRKRGGCIAQALQSRLIQRSKTAGETTKNAWILPLKCWEIFLKAYFAAAPPFLGVGTDKWREVCAESRGGRVSALGCTAGQARFAGRFLRAVGVGLLRRRKLPREVRRGTGWLSAGVFACAPCGAGLVRQMEAAPRSVGGAGWLLAGAFAHKLYGNRGARRRFVHDVDTRVLCNS